MDNNSLIDRYFDGEMSEVEMKEFETSVHNDPVLEKEFLFQQEIIESLKNARMAELKAGLNAIDMSGVATGTGSAWIYKTVASVVVIGGAITYFTLFNNPGTSTEDIATPAENVTAEAITDKDIEKPEAVEKTTETPVSVEKETITSEPVVEETKPEERDTDTPAQVSPDVADDFGDIDDAASNALPPSNELMDKSAFEHSTINVELDNSKKKYTFHYQLKGNTLFLYGMFDKVYEVLEFKHDDQSDLFFVYDNKYYNIDESQSGITEFQEMEGEELSELKQKIYSNEEAKSQ